MSSTRHLRWWGNEVIIGLCIRAPLIGPVKVNIYNILGIKQ